MDTAAGDVLRLLGRLKLFPELLIGHSFGGKVVMSMAEQFGRRGSRLPRPVKVDLHDLPGTHLLTVMASSGRGPPARKGLG